MKIISSGDVRVIMQNPRSRHNYFGWPTAAKLQNGRIAVVASGFRCRHVCPFGKTVIAYSEDGGETYTLPAPVIDTVLDDRDGGILAFAESSVIVTSFNNTTAFQRGDSECSAYDAAYLDTVTPDAESAALGVHFRISRDCGVTFGEIMNSPVTSPHGPLELRDGTLLWVGRTFSPDDTHRPDEDCVQAHRMYPDGTMEFVGQIDNVRDGDTPLLLCEPHAVLLDDGTILAHMRAQGDDGTVFSVYQSRSADNGKTWTTPERILPRKGGSPPHILQHSSGMLICTYGYREYPYGVKAMFSSDQGASWDFGYDIYVNGVSGDLGYPSSVELEDGSILTVFYAHRSEAEPAVILQQKWRFADE